jgi:hypothetical protein
MLNKESIDRLAKMGFKADKKGYVTCERCPEAMSDRPGQRSWHTRGEKHPHRKPKMGYLGVKALDFFREHAARHDAEPKP